MHLFCLINFAHLHAAGTLYISIYVVMYDLAICCLSVLSNSVDAECSVSQYTAVNAPQWQSFSDNNLALQVMVAVNDASG